MSWGYLLLLVPAAFMGFGLMIATHGARSGKRTKAFKARAQSATGLVTEVRKRWHSDSTGDMSSTMYYYPVVRFDLPDGRQVETETPGGNPSPAKQGAQVRILYDPDAPTTALVDTRWGDGTIGNGCVMGFGLVFALGGAAVLALALFLISVD